MAGVKGMGGAKGISDQTLPKDGKAAGEAIKLAGQAARMDKEAARAAGQAAKQEAGQAVLSQAVRQASQARQRLEEERQDKEEKEQGERERESRDTPELSRKSRWFGLEGKLLAQASQRWVLEMEEAAWEAILNWQPGPDGDIRRDLAELSRLYLALLEAILTYTAGEEQTIQQGRLDAVLAQKLSLIWDLDIKDLDIFFSQAGQAAILKAIKASLYRQATGSAISPGAAERLFDRGRGRVAGSGPSAAGSAVPGGGVYTLSKGGSVRVDNSPFGSDSSGEKQIRQRMEMLNSFQDGEGPFGAAYAKAGRTARIYKGSELSVANAFARHMNGSGNLFQNAAFSARNDEAVGYLAAATSIKGQVYVDSMAKDSALRAPVRSAVDQFVDYYLSQKGVYKAYSYTTHVYERTKSPQRALEEGLAYAYRLYAEKKADGAYRKREAYGERAGFFRGMLGTIAPEDELKRGMRILDENWRDFLRAIGQEDNKKLVLRLQNYSPWGTLLKERGKEREQGEKPSAEKKGRRLMAMEIFAVAAAVIAWLGYMLFFR